MYSLKSVEHDLSKHATALNALPGAVFLKSVYPFYSFFSEK